MSKFKNMKLRYKIGVGVASTAAVIGMGGAAFAYFTNTGGTDTGTGQVGQSQAWTVKDGGTLADTTLYPGSGTAADTVKVTNADSGHQYLSTITATLKLASGCNAHDFSLSDSTGNWTIATDTQSATLSVPTASRDMANGASYTSPVLSLSMNDTTADQNGCGAPSIVWTVS